MARSENKMFTDKFIRNLKASDSDYCRSEGNGFTIRVMPSGTKTWLYLYAFNVTRRKMNLGNYDNGNGVTLEEARTRFEDARRKVKNGIDPVEEIETKKAEHIAAPTVAKLITEYIEKHAMKMKRSWKDDKRILEKDALPTWGKRKAADIKKRDVVLLLEKIIERGSPGSSNNNFKIIRKMFAFAVERDILEYSPCTGVKMPAPTKRGDRTLTESEIKTLWSNLDTCKATPKIIRAIKLILVTGQRPGEVIGMHSSEINDRWWTIPAERSKNGKAHRVYLTDTALILIDGLKGIDKKTGKEFDKEYLFQSDRPRKSASTEGATKKVQPMWRQATTKAIKRNLAFPVVLNGKPVLDNEEKQVTENKLGVADFTPHDLRRTAATFMSQIGFMDEVIDSVLNHTKQGIIATYNLNKYDKEKQQALEAWERKLNSIVTGTTSNVISIGSKAA